MLSNRAYYLVGQTFRVLAILLILAAMMVDCSHAAELDAADSSYDPSRNYLRVRFYDRTTLWRPCRVELDQYAFRVYVTVFCESATPESETRHDPIFQAPFEPTGVNGPGIWQWEVNDLSAPPGSPPAFSGGRCNVIIVHMDVNTSAQLDCREGGPL